MANRERDRSRSFSASSKDRAVTPSATDRWRMERGFGMPATASNAEAAAFRQHSPTGELTTSEKINFDRGGGPSANASPESRDRFANASYLSKEGIAGIRQGILSGQVPEFPIAKQSLNPLVDNAIAKVDVGGINPSAFNASKEITSPLVSNPSLTFPGGPQPGAKPKNRFENVGEIARSNMERDKRSINQRGMTKRGPLPSAIDSLRAALYA